MYPALCIEVILFFKHVSVSYIDMPEPNSVCNQLRFKKKKNNACCSTDLPELHADGTVQLHQTCLKMHGLAFRVVQVDGSALVVMTLDLTQMHPQVVAKLTELCFAGVLKAELESCRKKTKTSYLSIWNWWYLEGGTWKQMKHYVTLLGNVMIQALHLGVVSKQIQALTVRFPQELHPRSEEQSVSTILGVFSTHSAQEHTEIIFMGEKRTPELAFSTI